MYATLCSAAGGMDINKTLKESYNINSISRILFGVLVNRMKRGSYPLFRTILYPYCCELFSLTMSKIKKMLLCT